MADLKPYEDVPLHACDDGTPGPLVTRAEHHRGGEYDPQYRLVCVACGAGVVGRGEQVAQAERARDAWEEEKRRQDAETFREQIATLDVRQAIANVRAALPAGETCTDEEALTFLGARSAKLGEGGPC